MENWWVVRTGGLTLAEGKGNGKEMKVPAAPIVCQTFKVAGYGSLKRRGQVFWGASEWTPVWSSVGSQGTAS